ncbi:Polymerase/histidinol phosphatase-like protein [Dichotomocladium elegans]|nr:Polymerase/histidinol phosphatase-like protein [Dichotomocladium elegans]
MPYSFHSHSGQYCKHGYGHLEDVVKEAIRKGFHVYGLTEHMPRFECSELYPEEIEACCTPSSLATTFAEFQLHARQLAEHYDEKITLLIGTEIEFIHAGYADKIQALRDKHQIDYVVGSLHHVGSVPIDFSSELYQTCLEKYGTLEALFSAYFDEQYVMLQTVKPEVVGHFDLIRIFAPSDECIMLPAIWEKVVRNVECVVAYNGLFEINSRAWKKGLQDAYPNRAIIKLIQEKGGRFTLSDDCHGPDDVGMYYSKLVDYLRERDIHTIHYLTREGGKVVVKENRKVLEEPFWNRIKDW